jgi:hypothetical protein
VAASRDVEDARGIEALGQAIAVTGGLRVGRREALKKTPGLLGMGDRLALRADVAGDLAEAEVSPPQVGLRLRVVPPLVNELLVELPGRAQQLGCDRRLMLQQAG